MTHRSGLQGRLEAAPKYRAEGFWGRVSSFTRALSFQKRAIGCAVSLSSSKTDSNERKYLLGSAFMSARKRRRLRLPCCFPLEISREQYQEPALQIPRPESVPSIGKRRRPPIQTSSSRDWRICTCRPPRTSPSILRSQFLPEFFGPLSDFQFAPIEISY